MPKKLLKGGNYSREETVRGNTVVHLKYMFLVAEKENLSGGPQTKVRVEQRPFFLGCKIGGVRIWQGVEIFPQHAVFIAHHAVFIAQQMLDQILRICKSFLKSGFFGHIWFLLFQN